LAMYNNWIMTRCYKQKLFKIMKGYQVLNTGGVVVASWRAVFSFHDYYLFFARSCTSPDYCLVGTGVLKELMW